MMRRCVLSFPHWEDPDPSFWDSILEVSRQIFKSTQIKTYGLSN